MLRLHIRRILRVRFLKIIMSPPKIIKMHSQICFLPYALYNCDSKKYNIVKTMRVKTIVLNITLKFSRKNIHVVQFGYCIILPKVYQFYYANTATELFTQPLKLTRNRV